MASASPKSEKTPESGIKHKEHCTKLKWTPEEDERLRLGVMKFGASNWYLVSMCVYTRTSKQCRERWIGQIDPEVSKSDWDEQEDQLLSNLQRIHGNKWTLISHYFRARSPICVKNRWYWLIKHEAHSEGTSQYQSPVQKEEETSEKQAQQKFGPIQFDDSRFGEAFVMFSEQIMKSSCVCVV